MTGRPAAPGRVLVLMRHAKSDWSTAGLPDFDRPLNARGQRDAPRMGRWLASQPFAPICVVASPAQRARETALAVVGELHRECVLAWEQRVYAATLADLLAVLAAAPVESPLLVVGHNPGLEDLAAFLLGDAVEALAAAGKVMPTAGLIALSMPGDWTKPSRGCAALLAAMRPRALP